MFRNNTILNVTSAGQSAWIDLMPFGENPPSLELIGSGITVYGSNVPPADNGPATTQRLTEGDSARGEGVSSIPTGTVTQVGVSLHTSGGNEIFQCPNVRWIQVTSTGAATVHLYGFIED